jgi:hypothetical protein
VAKMNHRADSRKKNVASSMANALIDAVHWLLSHSGDRASLTLRNKWETSRASSHSISHGDVARCQVALANLPQRGARARLG